MKRVLSHISGGWDSVASTIRLLQEGYSVKGLFFDYGQKYATQEEKAVLYVDELLQEKYKNYEGLIKRTIHLDTISNTNNSDYIPIRNLVLATMSANIALSQRYEYIAVGNKTTTVREDDPWSFKDCSLDFYGKTQDLINYISENGEKIYFMMPLLKTDKIAMTKGEVLQLLLDSGIDVDKLWSCYENTEKPCGKCYHCREALKAYKEIGIIKEY